MTLKFYLGMNYNEGGIAVAKRLIPKLEEITGDICTSRWVFSEAHEHREFRLTIAATDVADIARSDYVLLGMLTPTARGAHVEMGLAIAFDKPVYLYRPMGLEGVAFDVLCNPWKEEWLAALRTAFLGPGPFGPEVAKLRLPPLDPRLEQEYDKAKR